MILIGLFYGCRKEQGNTTRLNFGEIDESQKELQKEFELIINDLDNYDYNGNSIDSMRITKLICGENSICDSTEFPTLDGDPMNLKLNDLVVLSNGGMTLLSLGNGNNITEEIFLKNLNSHPDSFPFLELIEENNGTGVIYYGEIIRLNTAEIKIDIKLWSGLLNERLEIHLEK